MPAKPKRLRASAVFGDTVLMRQPQKGETMKTATTKRIPTLEQFLIACNKKSRTRVFDESYYADFKRGVSKARRAAMNGKPCYEEDNAGSVANAYKYRADTARWAVWSLPNGEIVFSISRTICSGGSVKRAYYNGDAAYARDFQDGDIKSLRNSGN